MDWFVVRHPDIDGAGVVPASSLDHHRARGWLRVSDAIAEGEKDHLELTDYTVDLDAPAEPAKSAPAKSTKEK
jgi:hypothetical protein